MARPISIERFSNIKPNGSFWVEGFYSEMVSGQKVMTSGGQLVKKAQKADANLTNMGVVQGFCERTYSSVGYVYGIDAGGYIIRAPASTLVFVELTNVTACTRGDIKAFKVSGTEYLFYTTSRYLGRSADDSSFDNTNQDFGALHSTWYRQLEIFLETLYGGNGNYLASLSNIGVWDAQAKQLPTDYDFRCMSANGDYMLISAESNNKGILLLWDGVNAWSSVLERSNPVTSIYPYKRGWIFTEGPRLYYTDGFTVRKMTNGYLPDCENDLRDLTIASHGLLISGDKIILNGGISSLNRKKIGTWVYDMDDASWRYYPYALGAAAYAYYGSTPGAMYFSSNINKFLVAYSASIITDNTFISYLSFESDTQDISNIIFPIVALEKKVSFKYLILNILPNLRSYIHSANPTLSITLKITDNKRPLWQYGQTNKLMTVKNELQVDGTQSGYNGASVGDEVLILEGINGGCRRRITEIANEGEATETYTLDSDLIGNTEDTVMFNILSFVNVETKALTDYSENRFIFDLTKAFPEGVSGRLFIQLTFTGMAYYSTFLTSIILQPDEVAEDSI